MKLYNGCFHTRDFNYANLSHCFFFYGIQYLIFYDEPTHQFPLENLALRDTIELIYLITSFGCSSDSTAHFLLIIFENCFPVLESKCY